MKKVFLGNDDIDNVVVQCACIGHCSYIEFFKFYEDRLFISIATTIRKKRYIKDLNKVEENFNIAKDNVNSFIDMISNMDQVHTNTYTIRDQKKNKAKLYIRFEYLKCKEKPSKYDQVIISFYLNEKAFFKQIEAFEITLTRDMWKKLSVSLRGLYEEEK